MTNDTHEDEPMWRWIAGAVVSSYATIYFSENALFGAVVLLCTLAAPRLGFVGLAGTLISLAAAVWLGFERRYIRNGHFLFNSLLVSLAVAYIGWSRQLPGMSLCVLLVVASLTTLLFSVALSSFTHYQLGLPPLSLPFVIVQLGLVYLAFAFSASITSQPLWIIVPEIGGIPAWLLCFLRSFGSIVFLPHATLGLAILLCVLCYSRLAILSAAVGYAAGMATLAALPLSQGVVEPLYVAFNFLFCGMALGGVFFVPSWSSLILAALGSAACAGIAAAEIIFFRPLGFAPLALPFNFVILTLLYALRMRVAPRFLHACSTVLRPEDSFRRHRLNAARFPHAGLPTISCPFAGSRVVTQGINGGITHRGDWRHALDFEVLDELEDELDSDADDRDTYNSLWPATRPRREGNNHRAPSRFFQRASLGGRLEDNPTFNTPVLSPAIGVVVRTLGDVEDRPMGESNFQNNWGNLVIIQLDGGSHVKLCHLKRNSLAVSEGDRVKSGELIGYCGNSGRSPVPHLHVQMQSSANVGATTIPFRLRHYVESRGGRLEYHSAGVPIEGSCLKGAAMNDTLAALFDNLAYRRYRFRLRTTRCAEDQVADAATSDPSAHSLDDHIDCAVDTSGHYVFRSSTGAKLTASIVDKVFYTLDYSGTCASVLYYLWLGLSRVPFIEDWGARWIDYVDARPMLSAPAAEAATLLGPFASYPLVRLTSSMEPAVEQFGGGDAEVLIACEIEHQLWRLATSSPIPRRIRVALSRDTWIASIRAEIDGHTVTIEPLDIMQQPLSIA